MSPRSKAQVEEIREVSISKILDASLELFALKGYDSTSIVDISQKAGVSKGLMYNYFNSKEDLLKALIDRLNQGETDIMDGIMDDDPRKTLENIFKIFFNELKENFHQWVFISKLAMQVDKFDFVKKLTTDKYNGYILLFESLLEAAGIENPKGEAKILAATFDGIGFQYLIIKDEYPLTEIENYLLIKYCKE